jgi:hypothetical protein
MKHMIYAALLALPLLAQPAQADYPQLPPMHLNGGLTLNFNLFGGGGRTQLGPWYQYWPHDAHFMYPPPLGPSMPGPSFQTLPPQMGPQQWMPPNPTPIPPTTGQAQPPALQRAGYFTGEAPSYWYGR